MPRSRSLHAVLLPGEIVQYTYAGRLHEAYFEDGALIRVDDGRRYDTPTAFANAASGNSVSGWLHCRVMRDGRLMRLNELPIRTGIVHDEPTKGEPTLVVEEMPPPPPKPLKIKRATPTLVGQFVEAAAPPLKVLSVVQINVRPLTVGNTTYWRHASKEKLYARLPSGGIGAYVGRYNGSAIQTDIPDSDAEI